jgi:hypothetical protein
MLGHGREGIAPADITGGSNVSDQDFFFDEDDKPAAKSDDKSGSKPAAKKGSGTSSAKTTPTRSSAPAPEADVQSVSLIVAVLLAVIGVLIGVVIGLFVGKSMAVAPAVVAGTTSGTTSSQAPQLTTEQLNSGTLPSGHPAVPGASTTPTTGK